VGDSSRIVVGSTQQVTRAWRSASLKRWSISRLASGYRPENITRRHTVLTAVGRGKTWDGRGCGRDSGAEDRAEERRGGMGGIGEEGGRDFMKEVWAWLVISRQGAALPGSKRHA
jgi:hypothetical protein